MPKIKDPAITLAPSYQVPDIGVTQKGVTKAARPRVIPSGKSILAQAVGELGRATGDIAKYLATTQDSRDSVEASDRLADLKNDLNQHYINNIAPRRSGDAKDLFKHEIETMAGVKEAFLAGTEGNKRLHDALSVEFDKVSQTHLQKVFKHKLTQDATYAKDTAFKVAKTLQSEMSELTLKDSSRAIDISNQLNIELENYPDLREAIKITAWKGMFKFNARINPELTQVAYENKTMRKSIVKQIGFEGYSVIQEAIDKGRSIGIQDKALAKSYAKEVEKERIEVNMSDAMHLYFTKPAEFNAVYIDTLKVPSTQKRILNNLLSSLTKKKLTDVEVDWETYAELLEEVRRGKLGDISIGETQNNIINAMNRTITTGQTQSLLKALSNRDVFDKPTIQEAYDELERLYKDPETFADWSEYDKAVRSLTKVVLDSDGDPEKVQKYMSDILRPPKQKSDFRKLVEDLSPSWFGVERRPEFTLPSDPTQPYMLEWEREEIDKLLFLEGHNITVDELTDRSLQSWLDKVRSKKYQEGK